MRIEPVQNITGFTPVTKAQPADNASESVSFKDTIKNALKGVNDLQNQADDMAQKLATGDLEDVHKAMLAMNKAKTTFDFTLTVRSKVLEAYQEVMRMQV